LKKIEGGYLIGKEDTIMSITVSRVDPGITDKIYRTMSRNVDAQCLKVELTLVMVSDYEGSWNTHLLMIPIKCNPKFCV